MAGKRKRPNGWEYVFKRAGVLDKPLYMTFASEEEGDAYATRLEALLNRGIIPTEHQAENKVTTLDALVSHQAEARSRLGRRIRLAACSAICFSM